MDRRRFFNRSLIGTTGLFTATSSCTWKTESNATARDGVVLSDTFSVLWKAEDPANEIGYCPALALLPGDRLIGCMLHAGPDSSRQNVWTVKIHTSDDRGETWVHRENVPMIDCFPFVAGDSVYVIGGRYDLTIVKSDDRGETWSDPVKITQGKLWYCHPGSAVYTRGRIYFVMEQIMAPIERGFPTHVFAPVVLSASLSDDLTDPDNWVFSNAFSFQDALQQAGDPNLIGVPFYAAGQYDHPTNTRRQQPVGWGETNVVQIHDPDHIWYDPDSHTFHLFSRAVTGKTNVGCMARAVESTDLQTITVELQTAPSGEPMLFVPFPGAQVSFHIVFDSLTGLYWMISSQATDSMKRVDRMQPKRHEMPDQERHRLALHFSKNCVDWCFAGLVAKVDDVGQSHHGGNMLIDGNDLHILMRTADINAVNAHNSNLITFHTVKDFRNLVY